MRFTNIDKSKLESGGSSGVYFETGWLALAGWFGGWLAGWLADLAGLAGWLIWLIWLGGWFWNSRPKHARNARSYQIESSRALAEKMPGINPTKTVPDVKRLEPHPRTLRTCGHGPQEDTPKILPIVLLQNPHPSLQLAKTKWLLSQS